MEKRDVEELLKCSISDEMYRDALESARRKQKYIYSREHRVVVLQDWYLLQLTMEAVIAMAFQKFTLDLCETLRNMEKERQINNPTLLHATIL